MLTSLAVEIYGLRPHTREDQNQARPAQQHLWKEWQLGKKTLRGEQQAMPIRELYLAALALATGLILTLQTLCGRVYPTTASDFQAAPTTAASVERSIPSLQDHIRYGFGQCFQENRWGMRKG